MKSLGVCALYYKEQQVFLLDDVCSCLPFIVLQQVGFITHVKKQGQALPSCPCIDKQWCGNKLFHIDCLITPATSGTIKMVLQCSANGLMSKRPDRIRCTNVHYRFYNCIPVNTVGLP